MSLLLPLATDNLGNPSPGVANKAHSFMHRVLAVDSSAPEQSIVVDNSGGVTMKANVVGLQLVATSTTAQPKFYAFPQNSFVNYIEIYHSGGSAVFNVGNAGGTPCDLNFYNDLGSSINLRNQIRQLDIVQADGTTPMGIWNVAYASNSLATSPFSIFQVTIAKHFTSANCNAFFADMQGNYGWGFHSNLNALGTNQWAFITGIHGANGIGYVSKVDIASGMNAAHYNYNITASGDMMQFRIEEDPLNPGVYAGTFTGKILNFYARGVSKGNIDYTAYATLSGVKVNEGGSTGFAKVGGVVFDHITDVANSGTSETDLYSDTIPASALNANNTKLRASYIGQLVGHATATSRIRAYFGGTLVLDSTALAITAATDYTVDIEVWRESASIVRVKATFTLGTFALASYVKYTSVTGLTLTNTQILKVTGTMAGTGAASNQIFIRAGYVEWLPAA